MTDDQEAAAVVHGLRGFSVGEWIFCEFELSNILEMRAGRVTEVTTGHVRRSSFDMSDRCFPLNESIKRISDYVLYYSDRIHRDGCSVRLNFPDIHRWLVGDWAASCEGTQTSKAAQFAQDMCSVKHDSDVVYMDVLSNKYGFEVMRSNR